MAYRGAGRVYFHAAKYFDLTLIGVNDQIAQNEFGASQQIDVDGGESNEATLTAEIVGITLVSRESGSGVIIKAPIDFMMFNSDPSISAGDTSLNTAQLDALVSVINITTGDYASTLTNAAVGTKSLAHPFITDGTGKLWISPINRSATTYNSAVGDDEILSARVYIRRDN